MAHYMVVREETVNQSGNIDSSRFPRMVEAPVGTPAAEIVRMSFGRTWNPRPPKGFLVIPMDEARRVVFKPREDYVVEVSHFDPHGES